MNFYQVASKYANDLSSAERNVLKYVRKNMDKVKSMTIRELAKECYVSTATIFRFITKLNFENFNDFKLALYETQIGLSEIHIPQIIKKTDYKNSYLKNIIEAIKVITDEKIQIFNNIMQDFNKIIILANHLNADIGHYIYRLLTITGYNVTFPVEEFEIKTSIKKINERDIVLILSYDGDDEQMVSYLEEIGSVSNPTIMSFTSADNNIIQNLSHLNFYVFADEINYKGNDISSRCGMIAVFETLMYHSAIKAK